jgi:hypothetical protein
MMETADGRFDTASEREDAGRARCTKGMLGHPRGREPSERNRDAGIPLHYNRTELVASIRFPRRAGRRSSIIRFGLPWAAERGRCIAVWELLFTPTHPNPIYSLGNYCFSCSVGWGGLGGRVNWGTAGFAPSATFQA